MMKMMNKSTEELEEEIKTLSYKMGVSTENLRLMKIVLEFLKNTPANKQVNDLAELLRKEDV